MSNESLQGARHAHRRGRRPHVLTSLSACAILAAAGGVFVATNGGGTGSSAGEKTGVMEAANVQAAASSPMTIPPNANGPVGRNPFMPLVFPPAAPKASAAPSPIPSPTPSPTSAPTPVVIVMPTPTTNPSPTATVTVTPSPTGLPTAGQAITLTLVSVDATNATVNATVTIGKTTTPYDNLKPGQVFGTYFKLVSILSSDPASPPVMYGADFQYGDQFAQLAVGDSSQFG